MVHALAGRVAGRILAVEPHPDALPGELAGEDVELVEALEKAHVVALLVDYSVFRAVNRDLLEAAEIIDLHGLWR